MSVFNTNVIDGLYLSQRNILGLVITDHLNWKNIEEHKNFLINKINSYIYFIENKQHIKCPNDSKIETIIVRICFLYKPNNQGMQFLSTVNKGFKEIYKKRKIRIWLLLDFSSTRCNVANKFYMFMKTLFSKTIGFLQKSEIKKSIMEKTTIVRVLKIFNIIFPHSDRMNTKFADDFSFDFCRMSNIKKK